MKRLALVAVIRTGKGSGPPGGLVVSGGVPPEPPAIGATPVAGSRRPGRNLRVIGVWRDKDGEWAYAMGSRVPIASRALAARMR